MQNILLAQRSTIVGISLVMMTEPCLLATAGVQEGVPLLELKGGADLRWAVDVGDASYKREHEGEVFEAPGLWALASVEKRGAGSFPADKLSQVDVKAKVMVGLVLGVMQHTEGSILLECLLRKSAWQSEDGATSEEEGPEATAAAGLAPPSDADSAGQSPPALSPRSDQQGGRRRMPSSRAAAAAQAALDARRRRPRPVGVHACLLAASSADPQVAQGWVVRLRGYSEQDPGHGVLEVRRADLCSRLCSPQMVRKAMGALTRDTPETDAAAALGVAMAMHLPRERLARRSRLGKFWQSTCLPIPCMAGFHSVAWLLGCLQRTAKLPVKRVPDHSWRCGFITGAGRGSEEEEEGGAPAPGPPAAGAGRAPATGAGPPDFQGNCAALALTHPC